MEQEQLLDRLALVKHTEGVVLIVRLLQERRERYRDKLESLDNSEIRGRAKECKDLIALLS